MSTPEVLVTGSRAERRPRATRRVLAWVSTVAATAGSTYALDMWSTATGLVLAASGVLSGLAHPWLLVALGASYVLWGLGLRSNVQANADLLQRTGASTNVFSKIAFDLSRRWSSRVGVHRSAAGVGYVATEIVKEAPYYMGAFAATLSDAVSVQQAVIFLLGTNVGAAGYEYGLAQLTRRALRSRRWVDGQ